MRTLFIFFAITIVLFCRTAHAQFLQTTFPCDGYTVFSFDVSPNGAGGTNLFAVAGACGVFLSTDNGANWRTVNVGLQELTDNTLCVPIRCFATSGQNHFVGSSGRGVFRSTNNGTSWMAASSGLTSMYIRTLAVSGTNLFAGAGLDEYGGFFLSTDYGASWAEVNTGRFEPFNFPAVYTLKVSETGLFVGTSDGLFLSTSNGTNWIAVDSGLTCSQVLALAVSGTNLFAGTGWGGIFLSTNNGTSWTPVNDGLPRNKENHTDYVYVQSLVTSGRNLFAGTGYGVFVSDFHGTSWTAVGMSFTSVSALAVSGTNLFAGTYGAGIWRRPLSEMVTSAERLSANLPTHFTLDQNYPNPFNPTTVISGEWTVISDVRLVVYDVLGREVAVLASGRYPPGRYSFTFDGANMASGVYFYRLMAGLYSAERKMVLVR